MIPEAAAFHALQARMHAAARAVRLPLRQREWRGSGGQWAGRGTGTSLDFQDHRPYYLGDDPRHMDWQAYARTGAYTLKLYREEVSPLVDLVLDLSASMFLNPDKAERTLELYTFAAASALALRGSLRCFLLGGSRLTPLSAEAALDREHLAQAASEADAQPPELGRVPWRAGSLRIWVSDLLFPGTPHAAPLAGGRGILLAPWSQEEATPDWEGNFDLTDCETAAHRRQRLTPGLLAEYRAAYERHFRLWHAEARRCGVVLARVEAEAPFLEALKAEALPRGAVEPL